MKKKILGIKIKIRHSLRIPEMVRKTKKKKGTLFTNSSIYYTIRFFNHQFGPMASGFRG